MSRCSCGSKTIYRYVASNHGRGTGGKKFNPVASMALNRGIELGVESVPQIFFQMIRIVLSVAADDAISTMQYFTVISSFAAIGFILAIMDYESIQASSFDELSLRYMVGCQRQNQSGHFSSFFRCFTQRHMQQCELLRGAHVCASNCICRVDIDTVFRIYVDKTFQENVHILPARSWLFFASIASPFIFWQSMWEDYFL